MCAFLHLNVDPCQSLNCKPLIFYRKRPLGVCSQGLLSVGLVAEGGLLPLGYDVRDSLLLINETEAALVRRIFDDFVTVLLGHADGQGLRR